MKKLFSFFFVIVCMAFIVDNVYAMDYLETIGGIRYRISTYPTSSASVVSTSISNGDIVIPSSITYQKTNYTVKRIDMTAFEGLTEISSITVPTSVLEIGMDAFQSVLNVIYYGSATGSPWGAKCINGYVEYPIAYRDDTKTIISACASSISGEITIPEDVVSIEENAFEGCSDLTQITVLNCKTSIPDNILQKFNVVIIGNSYTILPDTVICHQGMQICDKEGNCQTFYESGIFSHTYTNVSGCDSIVTQNVILKVDTTFLPDTTICPGGWIIANKQEKPKYNYWYVDEGSPYTFEQLCEDPCAGCDIVCTNCQGDETDWKLAYSYLHRVNESDECPEGVNCCESYPNSQQFYSSGTFTRTYLTADGCDSVVARNVIVAEAVAPYIETVPEKDVAKSGKILLYDTYCDNCNRQQVDEDGESLCPEYSYDFTRALYDYITVNGERIDHAASISATPSFNNNAPWCEGENRNVKNPDYIIENLSAGDYHIVFHSKCDSVAQEVTITGYGIEVDGLYYKINEAQSINYGEENYFIPATATLTYRGTSSQEYEEYSGNVVIPDSIVVGGEKIEVYYIDEETFKYCSNLMSLTFKAQTPPHGIHYYTPISYYPTSLSLDVMVEKLDVYVPFGSLSRYISSLSCDIYSSSGNYWKVLKPAFHVINPSHITTTTGPTSAAITFGNAEEQKHIIACGIAEGESFAGNTIEYIGLNPNSTYTDVPFYVKTIEGDSDVIVGSFTTSALALTTESSKTVSSSAAILLAQTNMSNIETGCGFEWKRNDAPAEMEGTKVYCPVAEGIMAGRLKNLKDDVYYKYRAFYESMTGSMYYGDWQYIFTGDDAVEFDPIVNTYAATFVTEHEATLRGYALEGADEFTEQGFEYWAESRVKVYKAPARAYNAQIGEKMTVTASGIAMKVTLTDLDAGTVYKYHTYAKFDDQVVYGAEMSFTTQGEWLTYTVTFLDKDGNILSTQELEPGEDAEAPEAPEVEGFTFIGWDTDFSNVKANLTVTAQYEKDSSDPDPDPDPIPDPQPETYYVVRFLDWDDALLKKQTVKKGKDATPPEDPYREGYRFVGWDEDYTNVQANLTTYAMYKKLDQALDQIDSSSLPGGDKGRLILLNGQLFILRGDHIYTVTGQEVR